MPFLFYNVLFTMAPVILFGFLDQDIDCDLANNEPLAFRNHAIGNRCRPEIKMSTVQCPYVANHEARRCNP